MGAGGEPDRGGPLDRLLQQRQGFDGVTARGPGLPQAKGLGKRKGLAALTSANPSSFMVAGARNDRIKNTRLRGRFNPDALRGAAVTEKVELHDLRG